jgi:hypothetical protein
VLDGSQGGEWRLHFSIQFSLPKTVEWDGLCWEVQALPTFNLQDEVSWSLDPSGVFSSRSIYLGLTQGATITHFKEV